MGCCFKNMQLIYLLSQKRKSKLPALISFPNIVNTHNSCAEPRFKGIRQKQKVCSQGTYRGEPSKLSPPPPPFFWRNENRCVFNRCTIMSIVLLRCRCLGTSVPSAPYMTQSLFLCMFCKQRRGEGQGPLEGRKSPKNPFKGLTPRLDSCWEERKREGFE